MFAGTFLDLIPEFQEAAPLVAASCLSCAVIYAIAQKPVRAWLRRRRIRRWANGQQDINALRQKTWQEFEIICGDAFHRQGYAVEETGGGGADDGADLILRKAGKKILVSCKHYKGRIGAPFVREAVGAAAFHHARAVYVVALSGFTKPAINYAAKTKNVRLIDGQEIVEIIKNRKVKQK